MRSISACVRPSAFRVTAKRAPISSNEVGSGIVSSACPVGCSRQKPISRLDVSSVACRRCLRPPLLSIPLVGGLGREAASPHQALTLSPASAGLFSCCRVGFATQKPTPRLEVLSWLAAEFGARLLVIDPHCWWARTSGGKSPLRQLSPAPAAGLFSAPVSNQVPRPILPQSDFRHSNQSLGVTFCSWLAVYAEASVDPA
jgi:hypothetical protein